MASPVYHFARLGPLVLKLPRLLASSALLHVYNLHLICRMPENECVLAVSLVALNLTSLLFLNNILPDITARFDLTLSLLFLITTRRVAKFCFVNRLKGVLGQHESKKESTSWFWQMGLW